MDRLEKLAQQKEKLNQLSEELERERQNQARLEDHIRLLTDVPEYILNTFGTKWHHSWSEQASVRNAHDRCDKHQLFSFLPFRDRVMSVRIVLAEDSYTIGISFDDGPWLYTNVISEGTRQSSTDKIIEHMLKAYNSATGEEAS